MTSVPDRVATRVLTGVSSKLWDLRANLMEDIVEQHGPVRSVGWFAKNMPAYEKILANWGPLRTHLVATALSLVNGCRYCAYGHAYAFQLHYFEQRQQLYSLSEQEMIDLVDEDLDIVLTEADPGSDEATGARLSREQAVAQILYDSMTESDISDEIPIIERALELRETRSPDGEDDERLLHLVDMFAFLNSCGIKASTTPDGDHDPINKNSELRDRYDQARREAGQTG